MLKNERQREIMKILSQEQYATVERLRTALGVSASSVRRDLIELEKERLIIRSYGEVELAKTVSMTASFITRLHRRTREKQIIAKKAAELVREKDIVFLDQSSSALFLAQELMKYKKITIVTNNIEILSAPQPAGITIYSSGGRVSSYRRCLIGADSSGMFERVRADFAFFSSYGLSSDGVIYDTTMEEVLIKEAMMRNAEKKVFLCDSDKFGKTAGFRQCDLTEIDYLISEVDCAEQYQQYSNQLRII